MVPQDCLSGSFRRLSTRGWSPTKIQPPPTLLSYPLDIKEPRRKMWLCWGFQTAGRPWVPGWGGTCCIESPPAGAYLPRKHLEVPSHQ